MVESIKELVKNRKELIAIHEKNNFTNGIHSLLTDLYPDTAHFIFELLQNAEDMNATNVRFELDPEGIYFEHNGSKRTFNLDDIDAITNIGHNVQKKDDPTSIGKFGVGFKAVFAYTATPEIQSGEYHFQIKDYFVPDFKSKKYIKKSKIKDTTITRFYFPFNNPQKATDIAYRETLNGLKALDNSSILFLQNIKKIEFALSRKEVGFVERIDNDSNFVNIRCKGYDTKAITESVWLKFSSIEEITDEHGNLKTLPISIAYAIGEDKKDKKTSIVPIKGGGKTFIYFPAEKEHSGLRFHINAPFASTVARDSVRNCEDNNKLIKKIAKLVAKSIPTIKSLGLINHSFFETLPNTRDNLSFFYSVIFDYVYNSFRNCDYIPTKDGSYVSSKNALTGPAIISNLFENEDVFYLYDVNKRWIVNALRNSLADYFLQSLDIQSFSYTEFITAFSAQNRDRIESFVKEKKIDWLRAFYLVCGEAYDILDTANKKAFVTMARATSFIQSTKKNFHKPTEIYILPNNVSLINKSTTIVNPRLIEITKTNKSGEKINRFLSNILEIQQYGPKIEIINLLETYNKEIIINDDYFNAILLFAQYRETNTDVDFSAYKFLLCDDEEGHSYSDYAENLYIGTSYGNPDGKYLAKAYNKLCISDKYADYYDNKQVKLFIRFALSCGVHNEIEIVENNVFSNPLFKTKLSSNGHRTVQETKVDYTIENIRNLLASNSIQVSKCVWKSLLKYGKGPWCKYTTAKYSPNGTKTTRTCDSTLVYYLKTLAWIPNKHGVFCKPADIQISDLRKDFVYETDNKLLEALEFGKTKTDEEKRNEKIIKELEESGLHVISEDDYRKFEEWKKLERLEKEVVPRSADELLKKQVKHQKDEDPETELPIEADVELTFKNAKKMRPSTKRLFGRIENSTKEEKALLLTWYQGKCQMCDNSIISYTGIPHFVARNIINTQHLTIAVRQTTDLAWNSLCLCPNCAAKYSVCSRDISGLYHQILETKIPSSKSTTIVLTIELDGKIQEIKYSAEHFAALKKAIKLIDKSAQ